jgi:hypothetical protein
VSDVVDVLVTQHTRMRQLCADVQRADRADKAPLFDQLGELVTRHERGDRLLVHPAARDATPAGAAIGVACLVAEGDIERALADLRVAGVGDPGFDAGFAALQRRVLEHNAHEERDEFPLLRLFVNTQRLHMMVGQLHDIQVMSTR